MKLIPIKTRTFTPPQDNLYVILDESLHGVEERDIVLVTSKVVSIHEGRCVHMDSSEKSELVIQEADYLYSPEGRAHPITIVHHALILSAGIDESNGYGYHILLPEKPYESAREIHTYLQNRFKLRDVGVIVTDSHSLPFRYGAMSVSIGHYGFNPVESHIGKPDLFGRVMQYSKTNLVDALAASATLVSGECAEAQPVVIARDVPNIIFTMEDTQKELCVPLEEDIYRALFRDFRKSDTL